MYGEEIITGNVDIVVDGMRIGRQFYLLKLHGHNRLSEILTYCENHEGMRFPTEQELRQIYAARYALFIRHQVICPDLSTPADTDHSLLVYSSGPQGIEEERIKSNDMLVDCVLILVRQPGVIVKKGASPVR